MIPEFTQPFNPNPLFCQQNFPVPGLALSLSLASAAQAGNLLKKLHGGGCETSVQIPAQRVVVETAPPRVTVQETQTRGLAGPVIGTVYMPMAMPAAGIGVGVTQRE